MTDREKAIVMAHTGITMLTGEKFQIFHEYIEKILGRPVWTHELADELVWNEIKKKSKDDFIEICKRDDGWIPISERLPDENMPCLVSVGKFKLTEIAMYSDLMGTISHKIFYQGDYGKSNFQNITEYVKAWQPLPKSYKEAENEDSN